MKPIFTFFIFFAQQLSGQNSDSLFNVPVKHLIYKITIFDKQDKRDFGYLVVIKDDYLLLSSEPVAYNPVYSDSNIIRKINYTDIATLYLRRTGTTGRAILIGTITGLAIGAAVGYAQGDDQPHTLFSFTAGEKAIGYGALGSIVGVGVGAMIGAAAQKKFTIDGKKKKFDKMRLNIHKRVYGY